MIRVIYTWTVKPGHEAAFAAAWHAVTLVIRREVEGARGSILLKDPDGPRFTAIARWTSRAAWEAFNKRKTGWDDPTVAAHAAVMREAMVGPRTHEVLEEIADLTVDLQPALSDMS